MNIVYRISHLRDIVLWIIILDTAFVGEYVLVSKYDFVKFFTNIPFLILQRDSAIE
jgi:hypothetical protein